MKKDGKHKLVGFVDLGEMHDAFEKISGNVNVHLFHSWVIIHFYFSHTF